MLTTQLSKPALYIIQGAPTHVKFSMLLMYPLLGTLLHFVLYIMIVIKLKLSSRLRSTQSTDDASKNVKQA